MNMKEKIQADMLEARKNNLPSRRSILSVLIGEIQLIESRSGKECNEAEIVRIITKLKKSCDQAYEMRGRDESRIEAEILNEYLPKVLTTDEIQCIIVASPLYQEIIDAKNPMSLMGRARDLLLESEQMFVMEDLSSVMRTIKEL